MSRCSECGKNYDYECLSAPGDLEGYSVYCAECAPDLHQMLDDFLDKQKEDPGRNPG